MSASHSSHRVFNNTDELYTEVPGFTNMSVFKKTCAIIENNAIGPFGFRDIVEALFPEFKGLDACAGITRHSDTCPTLTAIVTSPELVDHETTKLSLGKRVKLEHLQHLYNLHYPKIVDCGNCNLNCSFCKTCQWLCQGASFCPYTESCVCECC